MSVRRNPNSFEAQAAFSRLGRLWSDDVTPLDDALKLAGVEDRHRHDALRWWSTWTLTALSALHHGIAWDIEQEPSQLRMQELERLKPSATILPLRREAQTDR